VAMGASLEASGFRFWGIAVQIKPHPLWVCVHRAPRERPRE
jgi:hypothetical protein